MAPPISNGSSTVAARPLRHDRPVGVTQRDARLWASHLAIVVSLASADCSRRDEAPARRADATARRADATVVTDDDLDFCAAETNRHRAQLHLPPVTRSVEVEAYAAAAARADHASQVAHSYTDGHHGDPGAFAENEAVRWPFTPPVQRVVAEAIAAFWREGPGGPHYENVRGDWRVVGCGVWTEQDTVTVVQHFR